MSAEKPKLRAVTERMLEAFCTGGSIAEACGCGVYHVCPVGNSGNFDEGELERYEEEAGRDPGKYIFHDYSSTSRGWVAGHMFVMDCPCLEERFGRYADFVWGNRHEIMTFIKAENAVLLNESTATASAIGSVNL